MIVRDVASANHHERLPIARYLDRSLFLQRRWSAVGQLQPRQYGLDVSCAANLLADDFKKWRIFIDCRSSDVGEDDPARPLPGRTLDVLDRDLLSRRIGNKSTAKGVTRKVSSDASGKCSSSEYARDVA